jgi:hypothetical protein
MTTDADRQQADIYNEQKYERDKGYKPFRILPNLINIEYYFFFNENCKNLCYNTK